MALETAVFQQDPFTNYGFKDDYNNEEDNFGDINYFTSEYLDSSSLEVCAGEVGRVAGLYCDVEGLTNRQERKRRRRNRSRKNEEEIESQRVTHITVERNRRKQMNEYLAIIRSLMPPSFALRGDQASIVGGAMNFVKELEQQIQYLEAQKQIIHSDNYCPNTFTNFFTFPQYSTCSNMQENSVLSHEIMRGKPSTVADVEVALVETHASIKILSRKQPQQLLKLVSGFYSLGLNVLHLNVTTADQMALYSFNVKFEVEGQLGTVAEVATIIHEMMENIQEVAMSS